MIIAACSDPTDYPVYSLDFGSVDTSQFGVEVRSPDLTVDIPDGVAETARVTLGRLIVNGDDTGSAEAEVHDGDQVAIVVESASWYEPYSIDTNSDVLPPAGRTSEISIGPNSGTFTVRTIFPEAQLIGVFDVEIPVERVALSSDDSLAFIGGTTNSSWPGPGFQALDVSDPGAPVFLGGFTATSAWSLQLAHSDTRAYLGQPGGRIVVVDISNPAALSEVATFEGRDVELSADESLLFVSRRQGLRVLDASTLVEIGSYDLVLEPDDEGAVGVALSSDGDTAYLAAGWTGLTILDVSDPVAPTLIGMVETTSALGPFGDVTPSPDGQYLYSIGSSFVAIDVTNPVAPVALNPYPNGGNSIAQQIVLDDTPIVFVCGSNRGMQVLDVSNPNAPALLGRFYEVVGTAAPQVQGIALSADRSVMFLAAENKGLRIIEFDE